MSQSQYTDYLGNPIAVGDVVVYPTASGSSAADLNMGLIVAIDDLIPVNPSDPKSLAATAHKDRRKQYPPHRSIPGRWVMNGSQNGYGDFVRDDSKAYMLTVKRLRSGSGGVRIYDANRTVSIKNVDRVVVVSSLTDQREPIQ